MGAVVSCMESIFRTIGACLSAIVNGIAGILHAIISGIAGVFQIIIHCITCGRFGHSWSAHRHHRTTVVI